MVNVLAFAQIIVLTMIRQTKLAKNATQIVKPVKVQIIVSLVHQGTY
jgi:hypothetical protein